MSAKLSRFVGVCVVAVFVLSSVMPSFVADGDVEKTSVEPFYDLLIIAPNYWLDELQPLVEHKESVGLKTKLVSLDEVYDQMFWFGRDEAEQVKYFIKEAVENWGIEYVLLVGGKVSQLNRWHCPVRYIGMGNDWESEILSDLYFADVFDESGNFSSWDSNDDGVFAEWWNGDAPIDVDIEYVPDVAVGRLPCRNTMEVRWSVAKIISYETSTYGKDWFNRFVVIAGDTYPVESNPLWEGVEGEFYGDLAIENMSGFDPIRLYTSDGSFSERGDVIGAFNDGAGFIYLVGHGSPMTWGNNRPGSAHDFVRGLWFYDVYRLHNMKKLPILVFSGCHNLQFDVGLLNYLDPVKRYHMEYVYESIGSLITNWRLGGSIVTLGCTALGHTKEDKAAFTGGINELEVAMFHAYSELNLEYVGDMWMEGISWYAQTYPIDWYSTNQTIWEDGWVDLQVPSTYVLFGDPSLKIGGYPQ